MTRRRPAAGPCTTATTGFGSATIARTARLAASSTAFRTPSDLRAWSSALMPAPELKPRPAPPSRTTRTRGSVAACSIASAMPASMAAVREFRLSGRFIVTDSTPSLSVTERSSMLAYVWVPESMVVMAAP